jgi:hypothetical protein
VMPATGRHLVLLSSSDANAKFEFLVVDSRVLSPRDACEITSTKSIVLKCISKWRLNLCMAVSR